MFLSVAAVSSELVSTSGGSSHSPTPSMVGGQVSSYEKEKVAHFMSLALRYCMAHNSRRRDVDVDAVEQVRPESQAGQRGGGGAKPQHLHMLSAWCLVWLQDILRVLRAGGVTTAHQRGSISVVSEAPPINTSIVSHTPKQPVGGQARAAPGWEVAHRHHSEGKIEGSPCLSESLYWCPVGATGSHCPAWRGSDYCAERQVSAQPHRTM